MKGSELVPGQVYVVNHKGFRYNLQFVRLGYANSPSGGRFYEFVRPSRRVKKDEIIRIHENKIETSVEYPRYTQLDLI